MNRADVAKALEINRIERKHALDRIDTHNRGQPGVINLDALHLVTSFLTQLSTRYMVIPLINLG